MTVFVLSDLMIWLFPCEATFEVAVLAVRVQTFVETDSLNAPLRSSVEKFTIFIIAAFWV